MKYSICGQNLPDIMIRTIGAYKKFVAECQKLFQR